MSLFSTLGVGMRGLVASQMAINVTGQNISNADVEGFSRKRVNQAAAYRRDPIYGQIGMGADVINIERVRSSFIDAQIQSQNQEVGLWKEIDFTLESIENIFMEPGNTGIQSFIDSFFDSWQNLSNNPSSLSAREMVKTNALALNDVFHNFSNELSDLRRTRNDEIVQRVEKVNELIKKIYDLNIEIGAVETGMQHANDSRDKRDMIVKELSSIVDVSIIENEIGQISISSGSNLLVAPAYYQKLETFTTSFDLPDGTSMREIGIRVAETKNQFKPLSGQLKGLIESRDIIIPNFQEKLNTLARGLVERVNELHWRGYSLNGYTGIEFFDPKTTGASDINLSPAILASVQNIAAAGGGENHTATQNVLAAGSHNFGAAPQQLYRDPSSGAPVEARNIVKGTVIVYSPDTVLVEGVDYVVDYIQGTIQTLHAGYDTVDLRVDLQYRSGGYLGPGDNTNSVAIAKLRSELTMEADLHGNYTATFTSFYSAFIGELGLSRNQAGASLETREFLVAQYESHQDAIAGVSLDEEMGNLIRFEHTYQASARLITTVNQMLDVLLNM